MDKSFEIGNHIISVHFKKGFIRLKADYALRDIIKLKPWGLSALESDKKGIRKAVSQTASNKKNSLMVEMAGHVWAYKLTLFARKIFSTGIIRKISYRVCIIDCGEKKYDGNRWVWDRLAVLRPLFFKIK